MANTSLEVEIELNPQNTGILQMPSLRKISANDINSISDISRITPYIMRYNAPTFITLEHNINILDGSLIEYNNNLLKYGYISNNLSDDNCNSNNKIIIDAIDAFVSGFKLNLYGLLLYFGSSTYISDLTLSYTGVQTSISDSFKPNNDIYRAILDAEEVQKIEISFNRTRFPRMFTRLFTLSDDLTYILTEKDIISCNITDSFSPISQVIPINTADIVAYSHYNDFDLIDNMGIIKMLRVNSRCTIIGKYNNKNFLIGVYYIDKVLGRGKDSIKFSVKSNIGKLDDYTYQPEYTFSDTGNNLIKEIFNKYMSTDLYTIIKFPTEFSKTYQDILISSGTLREALQSVLFMINGAARDRDGIIEFYKPQYYIKGIISKDIIIDPPVVHNDNDINTISIDVYDYIDELEQVNSNRTYAHIYEGKIPEGGIKLIFDKPTVVFRYKIKNASGDYISDYGDPVFPLATGTLSSVDGWSYKNLGFDALYYNFDPQSTSKINVRDVSFIIEINYLIENRSTYTVNNPNINKDVPRLLKIQNPKIFNKNNVSDFSSSLLNYYGSNPLKIETKYIWDGNSRVGDTVYIYTEYNNYLKATIVKQSIDLGNGFISSITAVGSIINIFENEYMSDGNDSLGNEGQFEIIMNDNIQF